MKRKPTTIDEYLAAVPAEKRAALEALRQTIRSIATQAEECISYGIPAFRLGRAVVAGFAATAKGCSYYPFSGSTLQALAADLAKYDRTKSALHFDPGKPLPASLVRKLIKARLAEGDEQRAPPSFVGARAPVTLGHRLLGRLPTAIPLWLIVPPLQGWQEEPRSGGSRPRLLKCAPPGLRVVVDQRAQIDVPPLRVGEGCGEAAGWGLLPR